MTEPNQHEPNDFIREAQAEAAGEALRAIAGVGTPPPPVDDPVEEEAFQRAMRGFPRSPEPEQR